MQVAIVSTDGINVDEHFGRAERFLIYEINGDNQALIGIKVVETLSEGDKNHKFNESGFNKFSSPLDGCQRVYCNRIGNRPAEELRKIGIEPVIYEGPIDNISA